MSTPLEEVARTAGHPPIYLSVCRDLKFVPHAGHVTRLFELVGRALRTQFSGVPGFLSGVGYTLRLSAREEVARVRTATMLGLTLSSDVRRAGARAVQQVLLDQQLHPRDHHGDPRPARGLRLWHTGKHRAEPEPIGADWDNEPQWGDWGHP